MSNRELALFLKEGGKADVRDVKKLQDALFETALNRAEELGLEHWHVAAALQNILGLFRADGVDLNPGRFKEPLEEAV